MQYACRKTLADSRPRVRGRFAKNDELGEMSRGAYGNHEEDTDEDVSSKSFCFLLFSISYIGFFCICSLYESS